ncbi:MAG: hypothetical protein ACLQAT_28785 [Candidatus Binataceae bacterium]
MNKVDEMDRIDVEELRISDEKMEPLKQKAPRHWLVPYIRTIPLEWKMRADRLPGKAGVVSDRLWYRAGISRSLESISFSLSKLKEWGVSYKTAAKGLAALEKAGLVSVERRAGNSPRVTILVEPAPGIRIMEVHVNGK